MSLAPPTKVVEHAEIKHFLGRDPVISFPSRAIHDSARALRECAGAVRRRSCGAHLILRRAPFGRRWSWALAPKCGRNLTALNSFVCELVLVLDLIEVCRGHQSGNSCNERQMKVCITQVAQAIVYT